MLSILVGCLPISRAKTVEPTLLRMMMMTTTTTTTMLMMMSTMTTLMMMLTTVMVMRIDKFEILKNLNNFAAPMGGGGGWPGGRVAGWPGGRVASGGRRAVGGGCGGEGGGGDARGRAGQGPGGGGAVGGRQVGERACMLWGTKGRWAGQRRSSAPDAMVFTGAPVTQKVASPRLAPPRPSNHRAS